MASAGRFGLRFFTVAVVVTGSLAIVAPAAAQQPASGTSVTFETRGYANLARIVPDYQLGRVYLDGQGAMQQGTTTMTGGTTTRNDYRYYPEATMSTRIVGWSYSSVPHKSQTLVLTVEVVASNDPVDCQVGTIGTVTLVDDNRRLRNGQRRDTITQIYPTATCPSFVQGVSNRNAAHLQPTAGGPGGGQWADVTITFTKG